jgi:CBS domain-containing protein
MRVGECMTHDVRIARPDQTIREAARTMGEIDAGALPVGDDERLLGMITDRDIAVRAVAQGMGPNALVRDVMSSKVKYCFDDDDVDEVIENMGDIQVCGG